MTDMKITLIDPERMGDRIRALSDLDPSYEMTCQLIRAVNELHARAWMYATIEDEEANWPNSVSLSDKLNDLIRDCSEGKRLDELEQRTPILGADGLVESVLEDINAIFIDLAVDIPERDRQAYLDDSREYLIDSIQDFWSAAGRSDAAEILQAKSGSFPQGVSFSSTYEDRREEVEKYIKEQKDDLEKGAVDYLWEEKLLPMIEKAKDAGTTVGLGLLIGLGVGITLWLLIRGGKSAAARTPYGRVAAAAMRR